MTAPYSGESPFRRSRRVVKGTAPAAGADWSITVPGGRMWRVLSIIAHLVTSATTANRDAMLTVSDGTTVFLEANAALTQAASLTCKYCWFPKAASAATGNGRTMAIPDLNLPAGFVIASATDLIDTTDQWTAPVLYVVETTVREGAVELNESPDMVVELFSGPVPS